MRVSTTNGAVRLTIEAGLGSAIALLASYCAFRFHFNLPTAGFIDLLIVTNSIGAIRQIVDDCAGQLCGHAVQLSVEDQDLSVSGGDSYLRSQSLNFS
jgi:hypothetical protein